MRERANVREVGPRDGIQMVKAILPSARKLAWCRGAMEAGIRQIEVTSFVPAKINPQFADAEEVARGALAKGGLRPSVLVPNLKGAERAFALDVPMVNYVLSASEAHNQANTEASLTDFARIAAARPASGHADRTWCGHSNRVRLHHFRRGIRSAGGRDRGAARRDGRR
jgi:hydroxymethylglutaryl-CoA lyase